MCPPLRSDGQGEWSPSTCTGLHYAELGDCTLTCDTGYVLEGNGSLSCSSDGSWDGIQGRCRGDVKVVLWISTMT